METNTNHHTINFNQKFPLFPTHRLINTHAKVSILCVGIQILITLGDYIVYHYIQRCY